MIFLSLHLTKEIFPIPEYFAHVQEEEPFNMITPSLKAWGHGSRSGFFHDNLLNVKPIHSNYYIPILFSFLFKSH